MKRLFFYSLGLTLILGSCSPRITTHLNKRYTPLDYKEDVVVLKIEDKIPGDSEDLGTVKIGDTGFTTNCSYEVVVDAAKLEARKAGGNAIKLLEHTPPSLMGSTCHQITAKILKVSDFSSLPKVSASDSILANADYALLHIYRYSGVGALVGYDLYLGDSVICRVKNNWKKTVKIKKDGLNTIWARTEVKEELPVNIKIGNEYFIRCSITMGAFVGHPKIELVSNEIGRDEFRSIKLSKTEANDRIILKDNREIECKITNEDSSTIYFSIFKNNKEIKTQVNKVEVKEILRGE